MLLLIAWLHWLPVLTNVAPSGLCCKQQLTICWQTVNDIQTDHVSQWLTLRQPVWSETASIDLNTQWEEDWLSTSVLQLYLTQNHPATWLWSATLLADTAESFLNGSRGCGCRANLNYWKLDLARHIVALWTWRTTDHEPHSWLTSKYQAWLWPPKTSSDRWRCSQLAEFHNGLVPTSKGILSELFQRCLTLDLPMCKSSDMAVCDIQNVHCFTGITLSS